jgi:hypothetical protein
MKMIYQKDETEKPLGKVKIDGVEFGYKTIKDDAETPEGWYSHEEIVEGLREVSAEEEAPTEETPAETEAEELARLKTEEKQAKIDLETKCKAETGVNLDRRASLEDMQSAYEDALAAKELAEEEQGQGGF